MGLKINKKKMKKGQAAIIIVVVALIIIGGILAYIFLKPKPVEKKCGNGKCDIGENWKTCPADCPKPVKPICGDKVCEEKEVGVCLIDCPKVSKCGDNICDAKEQANPSLCPQDCVSVPVVECGNEQCESGETNQNCPEDCPVEAYCGDGSCSGDETCNNCPGDCGSCPVAGESHFGLHLGQFWLNPFSLQNEIRELGDVFVRIEFSQDKFGWKTIKSTGAGIDECESCCKTPPSSSCACNPGDIYYCEPNSRAGLITGDNLNFYNNGFKLFVSASTSRYGNTEPKSLVAAYTRGYDNMYRDYFVYLAENLEGAKYWELGNENDGKMFWAGTIGDYADLLVLASNSIKEKCSDCKVGVSFASNHPKSNEAEWLSSLSSICNYFDFFDLHFYKGYSIDVLRDFESNGLNQWKNACPGKEFISTETGLPDNVEEGWQLGGSEEKQAKDMIKTITMMFSAGYSKIYWYLIDHDFVPNTDDFWEHAGLLTETHSKKKAFYSYKTMINKVDYFSSISKISNGQYKFVVNGKNVYVLWTGNIPNEITGEVKVTDYLGNIETKQASSIVLDNNPIFVESA